MVAVTGPSGSGKTTLLNLLPGILRLDSGDSKAKNESFCHGESMMRLVKLFSHRVHRAAKSQIYSHGLSRMKHGFIIRINVNLQLKAAGDHCTNNSKSTP